MKLLLAFMILMLSLSLHAESNVADESEGDSLSSQTLPFLHGSTREYFKGNPKARDLYDECVNDPDAQAYFTHQFYGQLDLYTMAQHCLRYSLYTLSRPRK